MTFEGNHAILVRWNRRGELSLMDPAVGPEQAKPDLSHLGNKRFLELNDEERKIHVAKAAGYSGSDNPDTWANFRGAERLGVSPFIGVLVRMSDKWNRILNLARNPDNDQVGETITETLMDLSNYAKIAICLKEEEEEQATVDQRADVAAYARLAGDQLLKEFSTTVTGWSLATEDGTVLASGGVMAPELRLDESFDGMKARAEKIAQALRAADPRLSSGDALRLAVALVNSGVLDKPVLDPDRIEATLTSLLGLHAEDRFNLLRKRERLVYTGERLARSFISLYNSYSR